MLKVIFHIDESKKWDLAIGNIKNLIKEVEDNKDKYDRLKVLLLINAEAVKELKTGDREFKENLDKLSHMNVGIKACRNALNKFEIKEEDLADYIGIVPAGVLELTMKQNDGYAYIKP